MAVAGRLGPHIADFVAWKVAELPEEWLSPVTKEALEHAARVLEVPAAKLHSCTALELPDFPWAWLYEAWHRTNFGTNPCVLHVMLTARDSFLEQEDAAARNRVAAKALRALVATGKPPPFFTRIFALKE